MYEWVLKWGKTGVAWSEEFEKENIYGNWFSQHIFLRRFIWKCLSLNSKKVKKKKKN